VGREETCFLNNFWKRKGKEEGKNDFKGKNGPVGYIFLDKLISGILG